MNKIIQGNALEVLKTLESESVNCVVTSPPYWSLRDYGTAHWEGGNPNCEHIEETKIKDIKGDWQRPSRIEYNKKRQNIKQIQENICKKCGAKRTDKQLGLEITFQEYIIKLCDIFDEIKRVLKKDGTCFVNLGDTYNSHSGDPCKVGGIEGKRARENIDNQFYVDRRLKNIQKGRFDKNKYGGKSGIHCGRGRGASIPNKSLCLIPERFAIEMVNRGWILRNKVIWYKKNCMPSSVKDRFTVDFEDVFFFVKSNDPQYWINDKTFELVSKQPMGIRGIENKDWEWKECPACSNKNYFNYRTRDIGKKEEDCPQFIVSKTEKECLKKKICSRCKGTGKIKYSFWSGHHYWFEQQYDNFQKDTFRRTKMKYAGEKADIIKTFSNQSSIKWANKIQKGSFQGRNQRCVWDITTQSFKDAHFATFPEELPKRCIKAGCPEFICKKCGKPREKIYNKELIIDKYTNDKGKVKEVLKSNDKRMVLPRARTGINGYNKFIFKKYTNCNCNIEFEPGIVLDPFAGAGTTLLIAKKLNRNYVGIELNPNYVKMAEKRIEKECGGLF